MNIKFYKTLLALVIIFCFIQMNVSAQWAKTGGPPGMDVKTFYQVGATLFCGTVKGVYRSADNGITWIASNRGIENMEVFAFISDGTILYAGTTNGVFRSSDGRNWSPANSGIENHFVISFTIANGFIFAGTAGAGLFKTNTQGNSWQDANGNALNSSLIYAVTFCNGVLLTMADDLIFYSTNNGNTWNIDASSPFIFSSNPEFIVRGDSVMISAGAGVFRSFNRGIKWSSFISIDPNANVTGFATAGNIIAAGGSTGVFQSRDFGATWTPIPATGLRIGNHSNNYFYRSGNNLLLAYDEIGVAYSANAAKNWSYTLAGFAPSSTIDNAVLGSDTVLLSGTHGDGLYKSLNNGNTWSKLGIGNNLDSFQNAIVFSVLRLSSKVILAGTCGFGLYRSADNGVTWKRIRNGLPSGFQDFLCVNSLAKSSSNILCGTNLGVYYSADNGVSWNATNISGDQFIIEGLAANGSVACAASEHLTGFNSIYRSANSGVTWTEVFSGIVDWTCMASDGVDHFYAGTFGTNLRSGNNGVSWQNFGSGIPPDEGAYAIGVQGNNVFVGNSGGVYFSNNNAASFTNKNEGFDEGLDLHSVQGFGFSSNFVFAGLYKNAVWRRPLSDFGLTANAQQISSVKNDLKFSISPDPVVHQSILSYHVETKSSVLIRLYDAHGNYVKTLVNTNMEPGNYQQIFNAENLSAGNYFISIITGNKHGSLKFIVIK